MLDFNAFLEILKKALEKDMGFFSDSIVKLHQEAKTFYGWNKVYKNNSLIGEFYFTHTFGAPVNSENIEYSSLSNTFDREIISIIHKDHIVGFQFHPEKSGSAGLSLIENYLEHIGL